MEIFPLVIIFLLCLLVVPSLKVCEEDKRLTAMRLGRAVPLRGPGLVFIVPILEVCRRIRIGDTGEMLSDGKQARIGKFVVPVQSDSALSEGNHIRIVGFGGTTQDGYAKVELDTDQRRKITCEKCGHIMRI